jgi:hypothetical protein
VFKRERRAASAQVELPDERKALVERYMIDADEAQARTQRAADEQARREEAEARGRRVAEEHARRERAHREETTPEQELDGVAAVAHAVVEVAPPEQAPAPDPDEATEDLPIYAWVRRVVPAQPQTGDWTRALVEAKESRGVEPYRA